MIIQELGTSYPTAIAMCFQGGRLETDECGGTTKYIGDDITLRYDTIIKVSRNGGGAKTTLRYFDRISSTFNAEEEITSSHVSKSYSFAT